MVECGPTFNCPPGDVQAIIAGGAQAFVHPVETDEDNAEKGAADLEAQGFTTRDVLVGITSSGRTPYVLGAVTAARRLGARTIGVCCNRCAPLTAMVDIAILPVVGPEVLLGSTRLKAGTATKLVLNMLSTIVMVRRGFVFRNLMVNEQPTNSKLLSRARKIVTHATGVDEDTAGSLLESANGSIKVAVLMARLGIGAEEARQRLEVTGGRLSAALGE